MRYLVELDTQTKPGTDALKYLRKLSGGKVVSIQKWQTLSPKDVALPNGISPTDWQWEEYLNRKQGRGRKAENAFARIEKRLVAKYTK